MYAALDDPTQRPEALLLQGSPIGNLSTEKIFEYCAYYSSTSVAQLEWGQYLHRYLRIRTDPNAY